MAVAVLFPTVVTPSVAGALDDIAPRHPDVRMTVPRPIAARPHVVRWDEPAQLPRAKQVGLS